jgi:hypothetical protein
MIRDRLQKKIQSLLSDIKEVKRLALENNLTNTQWFIDFEDELNKLSGIEVINTDTTLVPKSNGDALHRLEYWGGLRQVPLIN